MQNNVTHSSPENSCGGAEVERTSAGVGVHSLLDKLSILDLVSRHCKEYYEHASVASSSTDQRT